MRGMVSGSGACCSMSERVGTARFFGRFALRAASLLRMQTTDTQRFEDDHHSPEERAGMIARMREINECLYWTIFRCGLPHAFIEFCGLMHEYVDGCQRADSEGADFTCTGRALPFEAHHGDYLGEKLNCIFGPTLFQKADFRRALIRALFLGRYELVEAAANASGAEASDKHDAA
jgi:hypothetical protein